MGIESNFLKRPGGPLQGKPVEYADGKWHNQFGEEVEDPRKNQRRMRRPGGPLKGKPIQNLDGQWHDEFGEKIEDLGIKK